MGTFWGVFCVFYTLKPRQNGRHFPDNILKFIFLNHSADSSNELADLHTTQTVASEVQASVVTGWPPACLQKLLPRGHQRGNWKKKKKTQMKDVSKFISICLTNPIQVLNPYYFLKIFLCSSNNIFYINKDNLCWYWGPTVKAGSILGIKQI